MKATNQQLLESYSRLGSIWKVATEYDMCGQSVWERLRQLGVSDKDKWTEMQLNILKQAYDISTEQSININTLSGLIGKHKANICRKARQLGCKTSRNRKRDINCRLGLSQKTKEWIALKGHPRGAYKIGKETRICPRCNNTFEVYPSSPQRCCGAICGNNHRQGNGNQGYAKTGRRLDLNNLYVRSSWEANYARYLNYLIEKGSSILSWEYEPDTFEFRGIKSKGRFYTPDFRVLFSDGHIEYHEVKGWDYLKGQIVRKRFNRFYSHIPLVLIDKMWFKSLSKIGIDKLIEYWE